jgi:hypothetical protein
MLFVERMSPLIGNHTKQTNIMLHNVQGLDFRAGVVKSFTENSVSFTNTHNSQRRNV